MICAFRYLLRLFLTLILLVAVGGCAPGSEGIWTAVRLASGTKNITQAPLDAKGAAFLRLTRDDTVVFAARGFNEATSRGNLETWFTSSGEVLRTLNGRIVSSAGLSIDWLRLDYSPELDWTHVGPLTVSAQRSHDEMPGYRFGQIETVLLTEVAPPATSRLVGIPPQELKWVEERSTEMNRQPWRFAMSKGPHPNVVYGEQCLGEKLCITWQRWPIERPPIQTGAR